METQCPKCGKVELKMIGWDGWIWTCPICGKRYFKGWGWQ
jgi:ribosomal protein L37AE/L43A